jgi:hypothetical protein
MTGALGKRAIVVGAGIGGLSTVGALSDYFEQVEIFERDRLSTFVGSRLGTPQDRHPHALLAGGLPGFSARCSRPSRMILPKSGPFQWGCHGMSTSSARMSGCCQSGIWALRCSVRRGR